MTLDKSVNDDDHVFEQDGFKVVISKSYDSYYKDLEISYVDNHMGKGFAVRDTGKSGCDSGCSSCS